MDEYARWLLSQLNLAVNPRSVDERGRPWTRRGVPGFLRDASRYLAPSVRGMVENVQRHPIESAIDFTPVVGDVKAVVYDAPRAFSQGQPIMGGLALASILPGVPNMAKAAGDVPTRVVDAGFKRMKSGRFVGAPPGVTTPRHVERKVEEYASRIEAALGGGVDRDYFYRPGAEEIARVTPDARTARELADISAITSSEAPVQGNTGWAIKAMEQRAVGDPIRTGKYPQEASRTIRRVFQGEDVNLGIKRQRYAWGLRGDRSHGVAPNDRWEIRGLGFKKDTATPAQHAFMDKVRNLAVERVNARNPGVNLDVLNGQELNWATVRADALGVPLGESAGDNVHDALKYYTTQHSWETVPGAGHLAGVDLGANDAALSRILIDESTGKDRLIGAMGGSIQYPVLRGPGVWEGQVHPYGYQSISGTYFTKDAGLDPASRARVEATEMARGYMLGQSGVASGHTLPSTRKTVAPKRGALRVNLGRPISTDEAAGVMGLLGNSSDVAVIPTPWGADIPSFGVRGLEKRSDEIAGLLSGAGQAPTVSVGERGRFSHFAQIPWGERRATETLLNTFSKPGIAAHADSPEMRRIAGEIATYYERSKAAGVAPHADLDVALRAWETEGIDGLRRLVRAGLAPAAVLGLAWPRGNETTSR